MYVTFKLAAGRMDANPWQETSLKECRDWFADMFNVPGEERGIAENQAFYLGIWKHVLRSLGDPDWAYCDLLAWGVSIGVDGDMPRVPEVFEEKVRWNLGEPEDDSREEAANYSYMIGYEGKVAELFEDEAKEGWMERMTDDEAKKRYGSRLHPAA